MTAAEPPRRVAPEAPDDAGLKEAAEAVRAEHRTTSRAVRLRALSVEAIDGGSEGLFALDVSAFDDFDWSWEGARALRFPDLESAYAWSGEVVEVDDVRGRLFVKVEPLAPRPVAGVFLVRPFDFWAPLEALYCGERPEPVRAALASALLAAAGEVTGFTLPPSPAIPELAEVWRSSWGYLWGPPGTGKTHRIGRQVAEALRDPSERILVVSTTNRATDQVALSIARALRDSGIEPEPDLLTRAGPGAELARFRGEELEKILTGVKLDAADDLAWLDARYEAEPEPDSRAKLKAQISALRKTLSGKRTPLPDLRARVVVTTAFLAMSDLARFTTGAGHVSRSPPFTTVIADEAGLISRVTAAALSLWASRRFFLAGDPRQLSPIAKLSRVLPRTKARWIARSALAHLAPSGASLHLLREQHRMCSQVREAVSAYQYEGTLLDAPQVKSRSTPLDPVLAAGPRAIWYVLDEDTTDLGAIRAERGPEGRSWIRQRSLDVMRRLFRAHPGLKEIRGLFISPFVAQARALAELFRSEKITTWQASTTHRQQGLEAEVVVFDTVNASSTAWGHDEWQRLINVGISRARELLIVLASRAELEEPYLAPLASQLAPRTLRGSGGRWQWLPAEGVQPRRSAQTRSLPPESLGAQLEQRRAMRPILSAEQQRLCAYTLDGKPRLVRGVAGSGKTAVLAQWLARRLLEQGSDGPFWVVYANTALRSLLSRSIEASWRSIASGAPFPWHAVELWHLDSLLDRLEERHRLPPFEDSAKIYDYELRASRLLAAQIEPCCKAIFVDEAQDFGAPALELITRLAEPGPEGGRSVNVFYDNAQNVNDRTRPRWSEIGLDLRGRSTVMKESFRSTLPINEVALNVLHRLQPPDDDPDHRELLERGLLAAEVRNGRKWWCIRYNQIDGPLPELRCFGSRSSEAEALARRVRALIEHEGVRPEDLRVITNGDDVRQLLLKELASALSPLRVAVADVRRRTFEARPDTVIVTTAYSIKGHEAEVVLVAGADRFAAADPGKPGKEKTLASALYVAMTRARSVLYVSTIERPPATPAGELVRALRTSFEDLLTPPVLIDAAGEG